jgi:DNA polymerase-3 subunit delta'
LNLETAIGYFRASFDNGRVGQGYVVVAPPRGDGAAFARYAMQLLLCESAPEQAPCGSCQACLSIVSGSHPDAHWVEPQKKSRIISVDQIRGLQRQVYQTSFKGGWKITAIMAVDRLGVEGANAFLKTLEEPPARSLFLLLTDRPQSLLPTIISRCQRLVVSSGDEGSDIPENLQIALYDLLAKSGGSTLQRVGKGERLAGILDDMKTSIAEELAAEEADDAQDVDSDTEDARLNSLYRERRLGVLSFIQGWYRDILLLVCGGDAALLFNAAYADALRQQAAGTAFQHAVARVRVIEDMTKRIETRNVPEALIYSEAFSRIG